MIAVIAQCCATNHESDFIALSMSFLYIKRDYLSGHHVTTIMSNEAIILQVFDALGLNKDWQSLDVIDRGCTFILENQERLEEKLPKRCIGDLSLLKSNVALIRRKSLMAFARRCSSELNFAIIRKRTQVREHKKTISKYSYKLLTA